MRAHKPKLRNTHSEITLPDFDGLLIVIFNTHNSKREWGHALGLLAQTCALFKREVVTPEWINKMFDFKKIKWKNVLCTDCDKYGTWTDKGRPDQEFCTEAHSFGWQIPIASKFIESYSESGKYFDTAYDAAKQSHEMIDGVLPHMPSHILNFDFDRVKTVELDSGERIQFVVRPKFSTVVISVEFVF